MNYVISDLHGEKDRYDALLRRIRFSDADLLYVLGDVMDREPDGVAILRDLMARPNVRMLLGNHELMCLHTLGPHQEPGTKERWFRNGGEVTHDSLLDLPPQERGAALAYLGGLPDHLEIRVAGRAFHLVHGFPDETTYKRVWNRPRPETPNPFPDGRTVIVGHTPVCYFHGETGSQAEKYAEELADAGEHMRIAHMPGFIDVDCGCGTGYAARRLACLRLEDMGEFYV